MHFSERVHAMFYFCYCVYTIHIYTRDVQSGEGGRSSNSLSLIVSRDQFCLASALQGKVKSDVICFQIMS